MLSGVEREKSFITLGPDVLVRYETSFVCVGALRPRQQLFCHVGAISRLAGLNQP